MARPNIIWIFADQWRHDATGYAGNSVVHTPNVDALAQRAAVYTGAYCESPVCMSSRASLLTVSLPQDHGKFQNGIENGLFPEPTKPNFVHQLRGAGYRTGAIGKMHFHHWAHPDDDLRAYGFDDVAEEYDKIVYTYDVVDTPYKRYLAERGVLDEWLATIPMQWKLIMGEVPGQCAVPEILDADDTVDAFIARQARDYLQLHGDDADPFFLWLGLIGPHPPYDAPMPYTGRYDPASIPLGRVDLETPPANPWGAYVSKAAELLHCDRYSEDDFRQIAAFYYGNITLVDEQVGRIMAAIDDAGLAENTWVVFSSDHGELIGDHGLLQKGVFYEASVRVPMLVVPPRGVAGSGRTVGDLVQGFDIPATILDLAGAPLHAGFRGRSLVDPGSAPRRVVHSQIDAFTMAFDGRWKLVALRQTLEPQALYDLDADPGEHVDLLPSTAPADLDDLVDRLLGPLAGRGRTAAGVDRA